MFEKNNAQADDLTLYSQQEAASESEDEIPLARLVKKDSGSQKTDQQPLESTSNKTVKNEDDDDDEDDKPLAKRGPPAKKVKTEEGAKDNEAKARPRRDSAASASKKLKDAKSDSEDDEEDDTPLSKRKASTPVKKSPVAQKPKAEPANKPIKNEDDSGSASTKSPVQKKATPAAKKQTQKRKKEASSSSSSGSSSSGSSSSSDSSDSEDEKPLANRKGAAASSAPQTPVKKEDDKKPPVKKVKKEEEGEAVASSSSSPVKKRRGKKKTTDEAAEEEEEEEVFKWWEQTERDGDIKWQTLEHQGVLFPPEYVPHGVNFIYNGKHIQLPPAAEEVATFFAALVDTDWGKNKVFQTNFFRDFKEVLKECEKAGGPHLNIKDFDKCDFSLIAAYLAELKDKKKNKTKEEKKKEKEEKKQIEDQYGFCMLDGRKEKVGNFRIEPPGLFRGRGAHPKAGTLKRRVRPEQVTINIGEKAKVPSPPSGHSWANVVHNNKATWLATWQENVNGATKYVWLAATSTLKGISDMKKYNKARELKKHIAGIRTQYQEELKDTKTVVRQRATALYLIDKLALRAGNEKDTDEEADTVGCCSLRVEHLVLKEPNTVIFDFLGKDSMRYYNEVKVDTIVFKNLQLFKRGKKDEPKETGDLLFDRISTILLNKHLNGLMAGLSAKVFRTYNASITFQQELEKTPRGVSLSELVLAYNRANREAAILCNHQRSVPKALQNTLSKLDDKVKLLKLERRRLRLEALELQPGKRKKPAAKKEKAKKRKAAKGDSDDEDEDDDDNDADDGDDEPVKKSYSDPADIDSESDFDDEMVAEVEQLEQRLEEEKEEKKKKQALDKGEEYSAPGPKRKPTYTLEQLLKKIRDIDEKIHKAKVEKIDKDENKTTALGTSKINYLDPRITVAWCKKHGVNGIDPQDLFNKTFNKSLQEKFRWAWESATADFVF